MYAVNLFYQIVNVPCLYVSPVQIWSAKNRSGIKASRFLVECGLPQQQAIRRTSDAIHTYYHRWTGFSTVCYRSETWHGYHCKNSWERGLNEHTNGLLRQYFPKKMPLDMLTKIELDKAVKRINNRPRKSLGYQTPQEVYTQKLFALQTWIGHTIMRICYLW